MNNQELEKRLSDWNNREALFDDLKKIGDSIIPEVIEIASKSSDEWVKKVAVQAMSNFKTDQAIKFLTSYFGGEVGADTMLTKYAVWGIIESIGEPAVPSIIALFKSPDKYARANAVMAFCCILRNSKTDKYKMNEVKVLENDDVEMVRKAVGYALNEPTAFYTSPYFVY